ncbi:hypothetical protein B0H19DRAFT_1058392 [Mycena capillaripes]|nr:hypothetical protein B0H19DRAFT_1058392 [Mycena capillaripes]
MAMPYRRVTRCGEHPALVLAGPWAHCAMSIPVFLPMSIAFAGTRSRLRPAVDGDGQASLNGHRRACLDVCTLSATLFAPIAFWYDPVLLHLGHGWASVLSDALAFMPSRMASTTRFYFASPVRRACLGKRSRADPGASLPLVLTASFTSHGANFRISNEKIRKKMEASGVMSYVVYVFH